MKSFIKWWLLAVCICCFFINSIAQPNISRVEYYIDTDPGYGKGTLITTTGTATNKTGSFSLNLDGLGNGVHVVGVRTRDANGAWSHDNKWLFAKIQGGNSEAGVPALARTEYYVNTDPGYGKGIAVTTSGSSTDKTGSFTLDITSYPLGLTIVGLRTKDANGAWSHDNKWMFAKLPPENAIRPIVRTEYYFDTDPGYGKGTAIAIEQQNNLPNRLISANITGLAAGKHYIFYRSQDILGAWSHDNVDSFTLASAQAAPVLAVNSVSQTTLCAADSFSIGYHVTGTYNAGNVFTAELSNAAGNFASPTVLASKAGTASGVIGYRLPVHFTSGNGYRLRIKSSNPARTGEASFINLTIHDRPSAQIITGRPAVNAGYTWPYSVPATTGSTYKWLPIGGNQTNGANTNTASILWAKHNADSAIGNIKMVETSEFGCVGDTSQLSPVVIYQLHIRDTVAAAACKGSILLVKTGSTGSFDAGNNLIAELSNASGSFSTITATATKVFSGNGVSQLNTFNLGIPANLVNGTGYRVRVRSTSPTFTGDTTGAITIEKPNAGADLVKTKCSNVGYNLTQHFTAASLTYTYITAAFEAVARPDSVADGNYLAIASNSTGCTDTAAVIISSNPTPNLGADTTVYHVCLGETTNLTPLYSTVGLTAVWNTANTAAAPPGTYRLLATNNFGCTDTAFANIVLETAKWTGTVSSNWHTAGNWSTGKVPTERTHVIVATGSPNICTISTANAQAASVQVRNGATIRSTAGKLLEIKGKCGTLP